jgi:diguanylate cyclase (GGDEF)-like protein/PAS domain S-box-containing protein
MHGIEYCLIERKIIGKLLDNCQAKQSLYTLATQTINLLKSHPLLDKTTAAIWQHDPEFNIEIIAFEGDATINTKHELGNTFLRGKRWRPLKIVTIEDEYFKARIDIHLIKHGQNLLFASFWFEPYSPTQSELAGLFKQVFSIFNLCFKEIVTQHIAINKDTIEQTQQIDQLIISEERFRNIMNAASDAIFIHDLKGAFIEINDAACKSLGYSRKELINSYVWDIETALSKETLLNKIWQKVQKGPITLIGEHRKKDGSKFPVEVRLGIFNAIGEKLVLAMVRDISAQKRSEETIRKLTLALEQSPVLVLITDKTGLIEYANAKVFEVTGYNNEEIIGQHTRILQSGRTPLATYRTMWSRLLQGKEWQGELLNKNKRGDNFWVSSIISPLRNDRDEITHYLAVMEDISQKKGFEAMLRHQATYDTLTNLPNRLHGHKKLEQAIASARKSNKKIALIFLDLDEFKTINDSLGHAAGDSLLKILSARYQSVIRQNDTIARLGGDEFMMIIENLSLESDAEHIARKCLEVSANPCMLGSEEILISVSIGIAIYPNNGTNSKILMRNADTAMYKSKANGKNNWTTYHQGMEDNGTNHIRIKSELHEAIIRDELSIHYQPIINIISNEIIGAEAFLRWQSPNGGQVPPEHMVSIAEETGLIIPLGDWILKKACTQIKEWQTVLKKPLSIAVNISTLQLKQKDFVDQLKSILKKTGLTPESLILEISESALVDDSEFILSQLNQLNTMNIHCSLDGFGMGYSSLSYIRHLPFKSLKIDKGFIQGIHTNVNDLTLVNSIITMSKNFKLSVIAEGVETVEQLNLIRSMNCHLVQGWLFSKPLSSEEFLAYVKNHGLRL